MDLRPVEMGLTEAEVATGLEVRIPASLADKPVKAFLLPPSSIRWTLDEGMVASYIQSQGASVEIPPGLDGTIIQFDRSDAVIVTVLGETTSSTELVIGASGPVGATSSGLAMDEVRSFLLELPGLPISLTLQLAAINDWESTLPVPVPVDEGSAQKVDIDGVEVIHFGLEGFGTGYFWVSGEQIIGVAGPPGEDGLEEIAAELIN